MQMMINATEKITTNSGLTRIPGVSSSKNLSNPAPAAGIGALCCRLFCLLLLIALMFLVVLIEEID